MSPTQKLVLSAISQPQNLILQHLFYFLVYVVCMRKYCDYKKGELEVFMATSIYVFSTPEDKKVDFGMPSISLTHSFKVVPTCMSVCLCT